MTQRWAYPNLWANCVGAWCPSRDRSRSTILTDFSPGRNHGKLQNMDAASDWVISGGAAALDLDGVNDWVDCGSAKVFDVETVTLSAWLRISSGVSSNRGIISKRTGGTHTFALRTYTDTVNEQITGIIWTTGGNINLDSNTYGLWDDEWHHVALVYDGATVSLWIDGNLDAETARTTVMNTNTDSLMFGRYTSNYAAVMIDDVRLYNRGKPNIVTLLASRRGIAYELAQRRHYGPAGAAPPAATAKNLTLLGVG